MGDAVRLDAKLGAMDEVRPYRRVEVITGRRQRRAWTAQEKARIVAESAVTGANISEVARRHGVNRSLLTVWRRQAGIVPEDTAAETNAPLFVPITVAEDTPPAGGVKGRPAAAAPSAGRIELDLRAGRLVFCGPVDPDLAAAVIAATWSVKAGPSLRVEAAEPRHLGTSPVSRPCSRRCPSAAAFATSRVAAPCRVSCSMAPPPTVQHQR